MLQNFKVFDCSIIYLPRIHNRAGNLTAIQNDREIPFAIQRVYYLYDIPGGEQRGGHAHRQLEQLVIAAGGSFDITLDDGINKKTVQLNRPYYGLHIRPGIWREINNFSSGAISLVLASEKYNEHDYMRVYTEFQKYKADGY